MKVGIISDLHIDHNVAFDFEEYLSRNYLDALILAGDTSSDPEQTVELVDYLSAKNKQILLVLGNHDYYSAGRFTIKLIN